MLMLPHSFCFLYVLTGSVDKSSDINDPLHELQYVQSSAWQYARISSAPHVTDVTLNPFGEPSTTLPFQGSVGADSWHDRGKWVKTFGYERVVFHPQRNLMYEFGGMIARPRTHHSDNGSGSSAGVLTPQGQSSTLSSADVVAQEAAGAGSGATRTATGATPIVLDTASGNVHRPLWDRNSGENLEQVVALPVNGFWDYTDGFSVSALEDGAFKPVEFLRAFRTYTVSPSDIVLVKQENFV